MKLVPLILLLFWCWTSTTGLAQADGIWNRFATHPLYANLRMLTAVEDLFPPQYFPKSMPFIHVKYECSKNCARNQTCQAFNVYETNTSYVCELQPDNVCLNKTAKAFAQWPGSFVWDKLSLGLNKTCLEVLNPSKGSSCELLRPGCTGGNWPSCSNCVKTCTDCALRYQIAGANTLYECILWPDGDSSFVLPIFSKCAGSATFLIKRGIDYSSRTLQLDYRMSFINMYRLNQLKVYSDLVFLFKDTAPKQYEGRYVNSFINSNGTLANMTLKSTTYIDIFKLNGGILSPTPFITVTDDRYGCGSFWLLDSSNATYCPGGKVGMLGKMDLTSSVIRTGIRFSATTNSVFRYGDMRLTNAAV